MESADFEHACEAAVKAGQAMGVCAADAAAALQRIAPYLPEVPAWRLSWWGRPYMRLWRFAFTRGYVLPVPGGLHELVC